MVDWNAMHGMEEIFIYAVGASPHIEPFVDP